MTSFAGLTHLTKTQFALFMHKLSMAVYAIAYINRMIVSDKNQTKD